MKKEVELEIDLQDLILLTSQENFNKGKTEAWY